MQEKDIWQADFFKQSEIFNQLDSVLKKFKNNHSWPTLSDYEKIFAANKLNIKPVAQAHSFTCFEEQYEPRIYLKNELQTRMHNWHDFFNALIWLKFPQTKKILNQLHYCQAINREKGTNRSILENRITLFDECGAIIISSNKKMLELIKNHQWQELFINQKERFKDDLRCIIFGHAIFEKMLNPYIGLTCHCMVLHDTELLEEVKNNNNSGLDNKIADIWKKKLAKNPEKFHALPLLGIPGLWPEQNKVFYENSQYFR